MYVRKEAEGEKKERRKIKQADRPDSVTVPKTVL